MPDFTPHSALRTPHSDRSRTAKLTPEQVLEIRRRIDAGEHWNTVGPDYGLRGYAAYSIGRRRSWAWLPEEAGSKYAGRIVPAKGRWEQPVLRVGAAGAGDH